MGWLIALGILTGFAILPLGAAVRYDSQGPLVKLILGPIRLTLYPKRKKQKKEKLEEPKPAQNAPQEVRSSQPAQKNTAQPKPAGGSIKDFLPLVDLAVKLLGDLRRKLRVKRLEMKLTLAGDDPCDLAVNYGRAWAAVGNLMPQLERLFVIKKRDVEVQCDFVASETLIYARLDVTITLGRLLVLTVVYGIRAIREFLQIRKIRKGGAVK